MNFQNLNFLHFLTIWNNSERENSYKKNKVQKLAKSFDGVAENRKSMGNSNFSNSDIGNRHFIIIFVL